MNKGIMKAILVLLLFQIIIIGCVKKPSNGPLIGNIQGEKFKLEISIDKVQDGLTSLLTPSAQNFIIKSAEIINYENRYFLKVIGNENQKCLIALKEYEEKLYELNDNAIPIVVCSGCDEGCEPILTDNGWSCIGECSECNKTESISDHYIFE